MSIHKSLPLQIDVEILLRDATPGLVVDPMAAVESFKEKRRKRLLSPEKRREYKKRDYWAHREARLAHQKEYRSTNEKFREHLREYRRKYRQRKNGGN